MSDKSEKNQKLKVKRTYYPGKKIKTETRTINGLKNGVCKEWHENGQLKIECEYVDDKADGMSRQWYENGQLSWETLNKDSGKSYSKAWHEDGRLEFSCQYKDLKLHGELYQCDKQGVETREYYWEGHKQKYTIERIDLMKAYLNNMGYDVRLKNEPQSKPKL